MILVWLILIPLLGGLIAWLSDRAISRAPRWIALAALGMDAILVVGLWAHSVDVPKDQLWLVELSYPWIPQIGASIHLAMDGLSLALIALTVLLGISAVVSSWNEPLEWVGFFHFNVLAVLAGVTGVFLALDLLLFYVFWEVMLVPTAILIGMWGHGNRLYAAIKFFVFTQAGGLLMLMAIVGLYLVHGATGSHTFDYFALLGTKIPSHIATVLMLGFFMGFAVKLPMVPLHTWAPDAYTAAPTAASVILAGVLSKTAGYGLLRFVVPLFPEASRAFAPVFMAFGVAGILYGAVLAFAQTDLKRLVAYSSVSHLGFVLVGVFALNQWSLQGSVVQMLAHGIGTGALFILLGGLQERVHSTDMDHVGGLWATAPRMGAMTLVFVLAAVGLPGLGNFVGEFLVLLGAFQANYGLTLFAAAGLILAVIYALWMMMRVFYGENNRQRTFPDLSIRETALMVVMALFLVWLGLFPQGVLGTAGPALSTLPTASAPKQASGEAGKLRIPTARATIGALAGIGDRNNESH